MPKSGIAAGPVRQFAGVLGRAGAQDRQFLGGASSGSRCLLLHRQKRIEIALAHALGGEDMRQASSPAIVSCMATAPKGSRLRRFLETAA
jgi:hypothetical protein